ncbi:hypothetical protein BHE74_00036938 [Ensete ventricosum]|uniref:Uncharacterized protein n=1 Tax=Ensete ventricosum TaxID=4639 RepID=A0A427A2N8_ENSVE|nr:hypothetical protein B296_00019190 [Ensete ventricosum]RWW29712.1 hypothetical protein GW17_00005748 [Ensete ventricosum]RWW56357.1 hypothetical protein BHE74_00036938 [Ensete ventricosum]RZR94548.1 hypothetical protein BHM03_00023249 [Ensete ventricosum]
MCGFSPSKPRFGDRGEGLRVVTIQYSHGEQRRTLVPKSFFSPNHLFLSLHHPNSSPRASLPRSAILSRPLLVSRTGSSSAARTCGIGRAGSKWELVCLCNGHRFRGTLPAHILR